MVTGTKIVLVAEDEFIVRIDIIAILIDQGEADPFLIEQLKPSLLVAACDDVGIDLILRLRPGYDHSYFFISTFMTEHLNWHAARLAE